MEVASENDLARQLYDTFELLYKLLASETRVDQRTLTIPNPRVVLV
jgi:hypothetical protein